MNRERAAFKTLERLFLFVRGNGGCKGEIEGGKGAYQFQKGRLIPYTNRTLQLQSIRRKREIRKLVFQEHNALESEAFAGMKLRGLGRTSSPNFTNYPGAPIGEARKWLRVNRKPPKGECSSGPLLTRSHNRRSSRICYSNKGAGVMQASKSERGRKSRSALDPRGRSVVRQRHLLRREPYKRERTAYTKMGRNMLSDKKKKMIRVEKRGIGKASPVGILY